MPLAFEPGEEAQVDWHEGWIEENGIERKAQFFCMRLCYSKMSFVWAYERANLESFLDGNVRAFGNSCYAVWIRFVPNGYGHVRPST